MEIKRDRHSGEYGEISLAEYEQQRTQAQQQMLKDSLTRAFDELHSGKVHHDARGLFKK